MALRKPSCKAPVTTTSSTVFGPGGFWAARALAAAGFWPGAVVAGGLVFGAVRGAWPWVAWPWIDGGCVWAWAPVTAAAAVAASQTLSRYRTPVSPDRAELLREPRSPKSNR